MLKSLSPRGVTTISSNFGGGSLKFMPKPLSPRGLTGGPGWVGGVPKNPKIPLRACSNSNPLFVTKSVILIFTTF